MTEKGKFLTIEGVEGAGKSTAMGFIQSWLDAMGHACVLTREPGGTPFAERLRKLLLSETGTEILCPETELLLFLAGRVQHVVNVIQPSLLAGQWVVSDRYTDATWAYQGGGRGIAADRLRWLDDWIAGQVQPDLTFLLDVSPETGLKRARARGSQDRIEQETLDFFERVRSAYLQRAHQFPDRIYVIDASLPPDTIREILWQKLQALFATQ